MRPYAMFPAPDTRCSKPCPTDYADWQEQLGDYRYGWLPRKDTGGGHLAPGCDWRELAPYCFYPGAKGADNAGGL